MDCVYAYGLPSCRPIEPMGSRYGLRVCLWAAVRLSLWAVVLLTLWVVVMDCVYASGLQSY